MPSRQWRILLDITGPNCKQNVGDDDDEFIVSMMGSCNLDPSVRFFGIEWERVFGRCFSLSLNVKIFGQQIMNSIEDTFCQSAGSSIDLILVRKYIYEVFMRYLLIIFTDYFITFSKTDMFISNFHCR